MKLRGLLAVGLLALLVGGAVAKDDNPINRQWLVILKSSSGTIVGVDPKSFTSVTPQDVFTFDMMMLGDGLGKIGTKVVYGQVSTVRVSCKMKQARVIADTSHDEKGAILARDEIAKVDKMDAMVPNSPVGLVASSICTGRSLAPNTPRSGS